MSALAGAAALMQAAAAFAGALALASGRASLRRLARALALLAAAFLSPALADPSARPLAVFSAGAAFGAPQPIPCLAASSAATLLFLRREAPPSAPAVSLLLVGLAAAAAVAGLSSARLGKLAAGADPATDALAAGWSLVLLLIALDGGALLRWRYGTGTAAVRLDLPGAGILLGLTLLASLGGALLLSAERLGGAAAGGASGGPRVAGRRFLILAVALATLGLGVLLKEGRERGAAGAVGVAGLVLATGLLACSLVLVLSQGGTSREGHSALATPLKPPSSADAKAPPDFLGQRMGLDPGRLEARSRLLVRLGALLAVLAVAVAGLEAWVREGTYATPAVAATIAAALLGLGAIQPTRLPIARQVLFLAGLLALLV